MEITKRNGRSETYDGHKIITAMKKAFESTGSNPAPSVMADLLHAVEEGLSEQNITSVEGIQDQVERTPVSYTHLDVYKRQTEQLRYF